MITHRTVVDVPGTTPERVYDLLAEPRDATYRSWWPGTHLAFHTVRRSPASPLGDVLVFDERVGRRRFRTAATVEVAERPRRLVWRLRRVVPLPAWLDISLLPLGDGTRVVHEVRMGVEGPLGSLLGRLIGLYFTPAYADALAVHATTEFGLLGAASGEAPDLRPLPLRRRWAGILARVYGASEGAVMLTDLELAYADVLRHRPAFVDATPVIRGHFELSIAVTVALYRVLEARGEADPLGRLTRLNELKLRPFARLVGAVSRLPIPWAVLSRVMGGIIRRAVPPPGWRVEWRHDSADRVAFDVHDCLHVRTFGHYGVPEIAPLGCAGDDILFARLPGARMERSGTLARGQDRCDFAFVRTTSKTHVPAR